MTRRSPRNRAMVSAISVSAALFATSTAFAVANGIFGARAADHVGSFQPITERLVPATRPRPATPSTGRPPASEPAPVESGVARSPLTSSANSSPDIAPVPAVTAAPPAPPIAHSTASPTTTANEKEVDDGSVKKASDDGAQRDD